MSLAVTIQLPHQTSSEKPAEILMLKADGNIIEPVRVVAMAWLRTKSALILIQDVRFICL